MTLSSAPSRRDRRVPHDPIPSNRHAARGRPRRAFTLVEAMLALLVVCLVTAAAMEATGLVARSHRHLREQQAAQRMAEAMLDEVLRSPYPPPDGPPVVGIITASVSSLLSRTGLIHIAAYHQFSESPPRGRDGQPLTSEPGWVRTVEVVNVQPGNPAQSSLTDQGLKRVVVTVSRFGRVLATASSLKAADD